MKKSWMMLVLLGALLGAHAASAATGPGDLPAADDPFWAVMAQLTSPTDPTCAAKAEAVITGAGLPGGAERAAATCAGIASIVTTMQPSLASEGVSTNLFSQTNWHQVKDLYFDAEDGKIQFTHDIDFMSRDFMVFLQTLTDRLEFANEELGLDADIVAGLKNSGAILTMKDVSNMDEPEILVNGKTDTEGVVSGLAYDPANDIITFNAAHFTSFRAVDKKKTKPKITDVDAYRYTKNSGMEIIKFSITGKHFDNKTDVKLGGKEAYKVSHKSSKKVVAYFSTKQLKKMKKELSLRVVDKDGKTAKFGKKIEWKKVK